MSPMQWYQEHCSLWVRDTYGVASLSDLRNRTARVAEEGVELAQSEGVPKEQVLAIVERCYSRPPGSPKQEAAGVFFTLLVYVKVKGINLWRALQMEYGRVMKEDVHHFREKQREKFAAGTDLVEPI